MYTFREYADMYMVFGQTNGNFRAAAILYAETYPNRIHPDPNVFQRLDQRLRETGTFVPRVLDRGRPRVRRTPQLEEQVLEIVAETPTTSSRSVGRQAGIDHGLVLDIVRDEHLHPYHYSKVQALSPTDFEPRMELCNWLLDQEPNLLRKVLWTDEACFTRDGFFNMHNSHYWSVENPHVVRERGYQHRFAVNVWAGILGEHQIGPLILPHRLNGDSFLNLLRNDLPNLMENIPLASRQDMWIQLDGAPPHFARPVRNWLNNHYPNRWIGRGGPVTWAARSPDLNPLDFFYWGYVKSIVYETPPETEQELRDSIVVAAHSITPNLLSRVQQNVLRRAEACLLANGGNFEHLF